MKDLSQALKYLLWPGLMLVSAGGVVGLLNGWTLVAIALLVSGLLLLVAGISAGGYATGRFWQRRATQSGTNAFVSVLSVLVILGLINFLAARYDSRTDLTENQVLSLSPASAAVVKSLPQPTELLIFSPAPNPADKQLLENYRRFNGDFNYRYVDPFAERDLAVDLGVKTGGEAFLRSGDRSLLVQQVSPDEPLSERQLTDKLALLNRDDISVAYFLQGHGEGPIDGSAATGFFEAATRLKEQNYTVEPLSLARTGSVPPDTNVLVIAGIQKELFENEIIAIRNYLESGGSVLCLIDPNVKTGLEELMSQWGVVPEPTFVIDISGNVSRPDAPLVQDYGDHPITQDFGNEFSFFPIARPLQIREVPGVEGTPLLFTDQNSFAQPFTEGKVAVNPEQEPAGPFVLGVALSRPAVAAATPDAASADKADSTTDPAADSTAATAKSTSESTSESTEESTAPNAAEPGAAETDAANILANSADNNGAGNSPSDGRLVVIGNSKFATDSYFSQQLNGDVFLNSVNWLSKIDSPVLSIRPKEATNRRFNMSVGQQIFLTLLALLIFPLLGLIGAGTLWAKRR
jgi:ABC-type uncharacterized transport system involved in gliding motility auxiliary subunit